MKLARHADLPVAVAAQGIGQIGNVIGHCADHRRGIVAEGIAQAIDKLTARSELMS